ncbi:MAG: molybdopterin-dependent oxidoreductase, partial [Solirubrobacteraceae bacterium]
EEGFLLARLMREALASPHVDSRRGGELALELQRALGAPALQARTSDLEFAHTVLVIAADPVNDAPILDLRLRKGMRRHGTKVAIAMPGETSLDAGAAMAVRFAPGQGAAFAAALAVALREDGGGGEDPRVAGAQGEGEDARAVGAKGEGGSGANHGEGGELARPAELAGADAGAVRELAALLRRPARDGRSSEGRPHEVVILYGERLLSGPDGAAGATALLQIAERLNLAGIEGAGLLEIPAASNGRGLREAGFLPNAGPGFAAPAAAGKDARAIAEALAGGELQALYLLQSDPLSDLPDAALWERAL